MVRVKRQNLNRTQGGNCAPAIVRRPIRGRGEASCREIIKMVPVVGIEPTLPKGNGILNPARLPIPPHRPV